MLILCNGRATLIAVHVYEQGTYGLSAEVNSQSNAKKLA